jgi:type I restriction enzyme S subunit
MRAHAPFLGYAIDSAAAIAQKSALGRGTTIKHIYGEQLKTVAIALPPLVEQEAISRFLEVNSLRLSRVIQAKRKVITRLREEKDLIVHRAITRGLDDSVFRKPSGIPWLGDIPTHWGVVRNMALFSHRLEVGENGLPVLQVSLRSGITPEALDQYGRPRNVVADATKYKRIYEGDIAYNTMRMWQGAVGVSPTDGLVSPAYVVLKPRPNVCAEFYDFLFHTAAYKQEVNRQSTGIVPDRNRLYWDRFKQMPNISLPYPEQKEIVAFIWTKTKGLETAIAGLEREIDLLRQYRSRLVSDIATGKLDARKAAVSLPDDNEFTDDTTLAGLDEIDERAAA